MTVNDDSTTKNPTPDVMRDELARLRQRITQLEALLALAAQKLLRWDLDLEMPLTVQAEGQGSTFEIWLPLENVTASL